MGKQRTRRRAAVSSWAGPSSMSSPPRTECTIIGIRLCRYGATRVASASATYRGETTCPSSHSPGAGAPGRAYDHSSVIANGAYQRHTTVTVTAAATRR